MAGPSLAFGKIARVKRSSRLPIFAAGLAGVLLIAMGLFLGQSNSVATSPQTIHPGRDGLDLSFPGPQREHLSQPNRGATPAQSTPGPPGVEADPMVAPGPASVRVQLAYAGDRQPAAGAKVSVWREQTGEGASFRPARRIAQAETDAEGVASLTAGSHQLLELYAQAPGAGPLARLQLGSLEPGEVRPVRMEVERPPAPMDLTVRDDATNTPVSGAAIRIVMSGQENLGEEEFPGTAKLVQRTDGNGLASLEGPVRNGKWLLVDAAGYSPTAIDLRMLDGIGAPEVLLVGAAKIDALVVDTAGEPRANIEVQLVAQLGNQPGSQRGTQGGGFRSTFTAVTNSRGEATFIRVPAGIPLVPHVGPVDEVPSLLDAITLVPGEERKLEISL